MEMIDIFRLVVCLGLMVVTAMIAASMKPRLYNRDSQWLAAFVTLITLSAFMGTAMRIGSSEPLVWYGAPLRAAGVFLAIVYIWKTRPGSVK